MDELRAPGKYNPTPVSSKNEDQLVEAVLELISQVRDEQAKKAR